VGADDGGALLTWVTRADGPVTHLLGAGADGRARWRARPAGGEVEATAAARVAPGTVLLGGQDGVAAWLAEVSDDAEGVVRVRTFAETVDAVRTVDPVGDGRAMVSFDPADEDALDAVVALVGGTDEPIAGGIAVEPTAPRPGEPVTLTADVADPDGYLRSLRWDVDGDGAYETDGRRAETVFEDSGNHTVALEVVDGAGRTETLTRVVTVATPTPSATPTPTASPSPAGASGAGTDAGPTGGDGTTESTPGFGALAAAGGLAGALLARRRGGDDPGGRR
jgi:hypothetical protein